jgi:hypothetical protein
MRARALSVRRTSVRPVDRSVPDDVGHLDRECALSVYLRHPGAVGHEDRLIDQVMCGLIPHSRRQWRPMQQDPRRLYWLRLGPLRDGAVHDAECAAR